MTVTTNEMMIITPKNAVMTLLVQSDGCGKHRWICGFLDTRKLKTPPIQRIRIDPGTKIKRSVARMMLAVEMIFFIRDMVHPPRYGV